MSRSLASRPPLVLVPQHFGCLVFDRRSSRYVPFDAPATAILRALAPDPSDPHHEGLGLEELLDRCPGDDDREALWSFHRCFAERGWFTLDGRFAGVVLDLDPPADHLSGPLALHLEVIGACNLACTHCFAGELPRNHSPLSLAEMDRLFGELAAMGTFRLGLTGGEPLLRRDIVEILDAATDHGLHPCLTTNGLCITDELARQLGRRELVWLNVSLDGATAATNDAVRGAGTYDRVLEALRVLGRHARFTLAFTITGTNAGEIEDCARLAHEVGAHTAVFRPLYPTGIALRHPQLMPTYGQYADALERLEASVAGDLHAIDPFSPQSRQHVRSRVVANPGCGAGNTIASISVQGDVNPCSFLGRAHEAGNIRERSFSSIWHDSQGFRGIRGLPGHACHGEAGFRGGCRARALARSGDIDAADPWYDEWSARTRGTAPSPSSSPRRLPIIPTGNLEIGG